MKSSRFNLEDTHLTGMNRISTLIGVITLAFVWAYPEGIDKHEKIKAIQKKNMEDWHTISLNMGLSELLPLY